MSGHAKERITPALLDANDAARYLGVSRSYFDDHLRQQLPPPIDMRHAQSKQPMPRFQRSELDALIAARAKRSA